MEIVEMGTASAALFILFCHDLSFGDGWVRPRLAVHYAPVCSPMADGFCAFYLSPLRIKMFS
jgi:hypothetical protein